MSDWNFVDNFPGIWMMRSVFARAVRSFRRNEVNDKMRMRHLEVNQTDDHKNILP